MAEPNTKEVYLRCERNIAALFGGHTTDGCLRFIEMGGSQFCGGCGCHRHHHVKKTIPIWVNTEAMPLQVRFPPPSPPPQVRVPPPSPSPQVWVSPPSPPPPQIQLLEDNEDPLEIYPHVQGTDLDQDPTLESETGIHEAEAGQDPAQVEQPEQPQEPISEIQVPEQMPLANDVPQLAQQRRVRRYTETEKYNMGVYAEYLGWTMPREENAKRDLEIFCERMNITSRNFQIWMGNQKRKAKA